MIFQNAYRKVTQTIVGGGGGSSFLDSEGSVFMTADEEAFCVDGNDRMVDVTEFPKKPLDNVVYKKTETNTVSDGQLTYINETTSYGIPIQTDHSNGLHYKNVEVYQYVGGEKGEPCVLTGLQGNIIDMADFIRAFGGTIDGYKVVDEPSEVNINDTTYIYLVRYDNSYWAFTNTKWTIDTGIKINDTSEADPTTNKAYIYYGDGGWKSLTALKGYEDKYYERLNTLQEVIKGTITEIDDIAIDEIASHKFRECTTLKKVKFLNAGTINGYAFCGCTNLESIDTTAHQYGLSVFGGCHNLKCVVLRSSTYIKKELATFFADCYHITGTVNETYNPDGLKDGYIYVPLSLISQYKTGAYSSPDMSSQIMPFVGTMSELYALDTSKYTIAYLGSMGAECKYENGGWRDLR